MLAAAPCSAFIARIPSTNGLPRLKRPGSTLRAKLRTLPAFMTGGRRPAQIAAIMNLEASLAQDRPRALIPMASGGGKTFTACNFVYRLIKHARAKRVLFLVDRSNLDARPWLSFRSSAPRKRIVCSPSCIKRRSSSGNPQVATFKRRKSGKRTPLR